VRRARSWVATVGRYAWAALPSLVGLALAGPALACGATARRVDGILEVAGRPIARTAARLPARLRVQAITFGHVVLGIDHASLAAVRPHEQVHVRQYERWGPLFLPLYVASSLVQLARGRDPYRDNRFEREAFAMDALRRDVECIRSPSAATGRPCPDRVAGGRAARGLRAAGTRSAR
jgi:hypothetical protein